MSAMVRTPARPAGSVGPVTYGVQITTPPTPGQQAAIDDAHAFLEKACNWQDAPAYTICRPRDGRAWASQTAGGVDPQTNTYRPAIAMTGVWDNIPGNEGDPAKKWSLKGDQQQAAKTHVHELGHLMEFKKTGVREAAQFFLYYRTQGETPAKLNAIHPSSGYGDDEIGMKDRFDTAFSGNSYYVGKVYQSGDTEIVSMGLEKMHADPVGFANADPEYFDFMVGVMLS